MTPRSLVGMTMGARKRAARLQYMLHTYEIVPIRREALSVFAPCDAASHTYKRAWRMYRIGQRLRPCPGCPSCTDSPRLQVIGWVRRIGGRAKLTRIFSRWYQRAEYLLMIYRPGPTWNPAAGGGVTKAEAWANMCNCLRDHNELNVVCDGFGVLPARAKKVRR